MAVKRKQKKKSVDGLLEAALELRPKEVVRLAFDPLTAKGACRDGLAKLKPHRTELSRASPGFDLSELESLPSLCDRLIAEQRKVQLAISGPSAAAALPAAQVWRRKLLPLAQSLAEAGTLDGASLARILKGVGVSDQLQDVLDLVGLLAPRRALVEAAHGSGALAQAEDAARKAVAALGKGKAPTEEVGVAAELRDRYATLITRRHDRLRAAMAALTSYRGVEQLVPSLSEGRGSPATKKPVPSPA